MSGQPRHHRMRPSAAFVTGVCESGKKGFWTKAGARSLVKILKRTGGEGAKGIQAYDCPFCDYWHAGHIPAAVREGRLTKQEYYGDRVQAGRENRAS